MKESSNKVHGKNTFHIQHLEYFWDTYVQTLINVIDLLNCFWYGSFKLQIQSNKNHK